MKKRLALIISITLIISIIITGCAPLKGGEKGSAGSTTEAEKKSDVSEKPVELIVSGKDYGIEGISLADNLPVWQEIEKKTNVKIKWNVSADFYSTIQLRLNAGTELGDIFCIGYNNPIPFIEAGLFVQLDPLIEKNAPNIKKLIKEYPLYKVWNTNPADGKMYTLTETTYLSAKQGGGFNLQGRKDWLDKLGLKVPDTLDEYYAACVAIKKKDPNGNGKPDEIPQSDVSYGYTIACTANSFGLHGLYNGYIYPDENGKVRMEVMTEEYKQALIFLNKMFKEGLLDPEWQTLNWDIFKNRLSNNLVGFFWGNPYGNMQFSEMIKGADPKAENVILMPLKGPAGHRVLEMPTTEWKRYVITKECKNPEVAMKFLDFIFASEEGYRLRNFGIEGKTYNMVNGEPMFTEELTKGQDTFKLKAKWGIQTDVLPIKYAPMTKSELDAIEPALRKGGEERVKYFSDSYFLHLVLKPAEDNEILKAMTDIQTYINECTMKFITGEMSFNEWDTYINQLKSLGIEKCQEVFQRTYDRLYKKGR
jgi:putative aldouronate transport system substrate-binding protein